MDQSQFCRNLHHSSSEDSPGDCSGNTDSSEDSVRHSVSPEDGSGVIENSEFDLLGANNTVDTIRVTRALSLTLGNSGTTSSETSSSHTDAAEIPVSPPVDPSCVGINTVAYPGICLGGCTPKSLGSEYKLETFRISGFSYRRTGYHEAVIGTFQSSHKLDLTALDFEELSTLLLL